MIQEFREFVNRGNVVELAVAFVLGVAFKPIVDAIVQRILMPVVGLVVGRPNFDAVGTFACEPAGSGEIDPAAGILVEGQLCAGSVGAVVTVTVNFLLVALALFVVVRAYNRMQREEPSEPEPEAEPEDVVLLREIRDVLARD